MDSYRLLKFEYCSYNLVKSLVISCYDGKNPEQLV